MPSTSTRCWRRSPCIGRVAGAGPDGLDLSLQVVEASRCSTSRATDLQGDALAQAENSMGSEREIARAVPAGGGDAEQPARMDAAAWLRVRDPAGRCDGVGPTVRHQAQAAGTLTTTQQQRVAEETARSPSNRQARIPSMCRSTIRRSLRRLADRRISLCIFRRRPTIRWTARLLADLLWTGVVIVGSLWGWAHRGGIRPRPRRRGPLQPYQREPGRDPVRGLASTAPVVVGQPFVRQWGRLSAASDALRRPPSSRRMS